MLLFCSALSQIRAVALDVTNPEQVRAAISSAIDAFGRLDVVVNDAILYRKKSRYACC